VPGWWRSRARSGAFASIQLPSRSPKCRAHSCDTLIRLPAIDRPMRPIVLHVILLASMIVTATLAGDAAAVRKELAAIGKLRVGVVSAPKANVFFVVADAGGKPRGVTADLGDELARTLDVAAEFSVAHNSGELTDELEK